MDAHGVDLPSIISGIGGGHGRGNVVRMQIERRRIAIYEIRAY